MLAAAVVVLVVISTLNLLLAFALISRYREHSTLIQRLLAPAESVPKLMMAAGLEPGAFEPVQAVDGGSLTRDQLNGALVGFFSPTCAVCHERADGFARLARTLDREIVVAVVIQDGGGDGTSAERRLVGMLEPVARVVLEPDQGPVQRAFGVIGTPALFVVGEDGRIAGNAFRAGDLPAVPVPDRTA